MLYYIPLKQGFDEAIKIVDFMNSLRPDKVQMLLELCTSVKVKRLFLYMAEKQDHFWHKELNLEKINLGTGNRVIVKNGILYAKYQAPNSKPVSMRGWFFYAKDYCLDIEFNFLGNNLKFL